MRSLRDEYYWHVTEREELPDDYRLAYTDENGIIRDVYNDSIIENK